MDSCWGDIPQIVSHVYGECLITCIALFGVITRTTSPGISSYKRQESIDLANEVIIIGPILTKGLVPFTQLVKKGGVSWFWHFPASDFHETFTRSSFLDALASLDFKLSLSQRFTFFTASASTGLSELFVFELERNISMFSA